MLVTEQTAYSTAMNSISLLATDGLRQIRQIRKCMQSAWNPSNPWNPSRDGPSRSRGPTATRTHARARPTASYMLRAARAIAAYR